MLKKRILLVPLLLSLSLFLGGCPDLTTSVFRGGASLTASVNNPVTPSMLLDVEESLIVVTGGLQTYKNLCVKKVIDRSCRSVITNVQSYTRPARRILPQVRVFVRNNDQVNAIVAFNVLRGLVTNARQIADANNIGAK